MVEPDKKMVEDINRMSQTEMARLWRHAKPGHPYFDSSLPYYEIFEKRFKALGGFTPAISKEV